jgi:predicted nucleic acid-binding protein
MTSTIADARPFVDTNILVYAYDRSEGARHDRARALLDGLWASGGGCISTQVLVEFANVATAKMPQPILAADAADIVRDLGGWRCHRPSPGDIALAVEMRRALQLSLWDSLIVRSAIALGCTELWSEDFTAGRTYDGVTVRNPLVA